jgi:hypothetical protein
MAETVPGILHSASYFYGRKHPQSAVELAAFGYGIAVGTEHDCAGIALVRHKPITDYVPDLVDPSVQTRI